MIGCYFLKGCSCFLLLGMESGHLQDNALSASTSNDTNHTNHAPQQSRFNTVPSKGRTGAWCAKKNEVNQWLQIYFGRETTVSKVATQGYDGDHWVMSYSLSYSVDGSHWAWYRLSDGKIKVLLQLICRFRVLLRVCFKASLSAKPFIRK